MKIALVRRGFSHSGGAETYLLRLMAELTRAGHELALVTDQPWPEERLAMHGLTPFCSLLPVSSASGFADAVQTWRASNPVDAMLSLERVWACDIFRAGDGVHASWLERRAAHEPAWKTWIRRWNGKHRELLKLETSLFKGGANLIIANSKMVKAEIAARYGTPVERITVIYNGVPEWIEEPGLRERSRVDLGLAGRDYVLLFAGSGWERKGLRFAMQAVETLPNAQLLVAGRGKTAALPRCTRTRLLGSQTSAEMRKLLAAADAFILPTLYEPFSNACLEALSAGLPVITTTANGFAEIINPGEEGEVLADATDVAGLATALASWADPLRRASIRPALMEKGRAFSISRNVTETLALLTANE